MLFYIIGLLTIFSLIGLVVYLAIDRTRNRRDLSSDVISYIDVFDSIPDVMGIQDTERRIIRYNNAGYKYLNLSPEQAIGKHCYELIGRDSPCIPCSTRDAVTTGEVTSHVKYVPVTDTWFNVRAYPIKNSRGIVEKVVEHLRDISEEKRLQSALENVNKDLETQVEKRTEDLQETIRELTVTRDQLIESEKLSALGRMVAGISHEVNTPLGIAITSASYIKDLMNDFDDSKTGEFFSQLENACTLVNSNLKRAGDLMRSFKRIAADQTSERLREIEPVEYLRELERSLFPVLKRGQITTGIEYEPTGFLTTYPGALSQILTNLYMNSLNHAFADRDDRRITLNIKPSLDGIVLEFADNGCGMEVEVLKHLYEPFYSSSLGSEGIGLGMNIVYNLVMGKLRGSIHCESSPGNGTRYTLTLPDLDQE